ARDGARVQAADPALRPRLRLRRRPRGCARPARGVRGARCRLPRARRGPRRRPPRPADQPMKVSLLANPSYVDKAFPPGWPVPGRDWDPDLGAESMARAYDVYDVAFDLGFDWLAVSEHHYFPSLLGPNPMLVAATLANRYPTVGIAVLGAVLPQVN